jgi:N-acylneuraminate cytidylyltransferase
MKNIKLFAGKPLVYWAVKASEDCSKIDRVYVATDSEQIRKIVRGFGLSKVKVIERSAESSTDTASTESAMLEFAKRYEFDNIALVQATSPLLTDEDLSRGFGELEFADSVLSVVRQKRFIWKQDEYATSVNYDCNNRPRRQEFDGFLVENGAFYITSRESLLGSGCRLSGNIKTVEMSGESYFEIDEPSDWPVAEQLLRRRLSEKPHTTIKMFLTDCDGTLTDGGMYYSAEGDAMKKFNTRDGVGLRLLKEHGIITGITTCEDSEIVRKRGEKLNADEILLGVSDKVQAVKGLCEKYDIKLSEVAYIGDDLNDIGVMNTVGLAICPANAATAVKAGANYITECSGGQGAVREAAEYILGEFVHER